MAACRRRSTCAGADLGASGEAAAEAAQLAIQYVPNPPVHAGDPSQAPAPLVEKTKDNQKAGFVTPVSQAVHRLLAEQ